MDRPLSCIYFNSSFLAKWFCLSFKLLFELDIVLSLVASFLQVLWSFGKLVLKYRFLDPCWVLLRCKFVDIEAQAGLPVRLYACLCVCFCVHQRFQCQCPGVANFYSNFFSTNSMRWALGLQPVEGYKAAPTFVFHKEPCWTSMYMCECPQTYPLWTDAHRFTFCSGF